MAASPKFKTVHEESSDIGSGPSPAVRASGPDDADARSPARELQARLGQALGKPATSDVWHPAQTTLFVLGTCGAFWSVMIAGAIAIF